MTLSSIGHQLYFKVILPIPIQWATISFSSFGHCCVLSIPIHTIMRWHQRIPCGIVFLCWNISSKTVARTGAKTFNAKKPDKFAVRFYAVAGSVNPYISSFFDNRAGNKTGVCAAVNCCRIFHSLWTPYNNEFHSNNKIKIEKDFPSSLWLLQMAHQTQNFPDPSGRRVFFVEKFLYTSSISTCSKGDERWRVKNDWYSTVHYVQKAIDLLDAKPHGSWCLVRAYDEHPELSLN